MKRWTIGLTGLLVALTAACSGTADKATPSSPSTAAADAVGIVLVEDGLGSLGPPPGVENSCPGCNRWPTQFADRIAEVTGEETRLAAYRAGGVTEAMELVSGDAETRTAIAEAEVIVVATGSFNSLPSPDTGIGCPETPADEATYAAWARTTSSACLGEMIKTYGLLYNGVFAEINKLREGQETLCVVLNALNFNIDVGGADSLLGQVRGAERAWARKFAVAANDRWNVMLAERAEAAGCTVVDIYHAFNGADGTKAVARFFPSGTSTPNQAGQDLIASLVTQVDLGALQP